MKDHFDTLLYLVVGAVYLYLKKAKNRNAEKQTIPDTPSEPLPAPTTSTDWRDAWRNDTQEALVKKPLLQTAIAKRPLPAEHHTTPHPAAQQPHGKKIDRVLRRYGGWKKAIILGELIQPYS
jgi:hypothetical protein